MKYLLATWEGGGVVPPEMGIARRLVARGHEVRVLADPACEAAARAAGCAFSPWVTAPHKHSLAPEEDVMRDWEFKNIFKLFEHILEVFVSGPADKFVADTRAVLEAHPVDAMLVDAMLFGPQIVAEAARIPIALLMPNIYMRPAPGIPAFGPGFLPAKGALGRVRDALLKAMGNKMWKKALPGINRARAGQGLPPLTDLWSQYDRADRVLVLTSPAFDLVSPALPANVRYVGPVLDDPSWAASWTPAWPSDNRDPIVLTGLSSTYQNQLAVLKNVVGVLGELPVRALVTLGPALAPDAVTSRAPHVCIVPTAPHAVVLKHAALTITHCGHGTAIRSLAAGVPLVCIPMGRDQNDTAARVVYRGAGVRLKPAATAAAVRRAIETVLTDPRYRAGARALADAIVRDAGDPIAEIEALTPASKRSAGVAATVPPSARVAASA
jgi:MGT family glycosyltransferase